MTSDPVREMTEEEMTATDLVEILSRVERFTGPNAARYLRGHIDALQAKLSQVEKDLTSANARYDELLHTTEISEKELQARAVALEKWEAAMALNEQGARTTAGRSFLEGLEEQRRKLTLAEERVKELEGFCENLRLLARRDHEALVKILLEHRWSEAGQIAHAALSPTQSETKEQLT